MKYNLRCVNCGNDIGRLKEWFSHDQQCPKCSGKRAEVDYNVSYDNLQNIIHYNGSSNLDSFWAYFDYLPLENKSNIVSLNEGTAPIEEWSFLEDYASKVYGVDCKVFIYRNDLNGGTHTFKDVAGSLAASVFKEHGVTDYCAASTGNTALAYSKYLYQGGIKFHIFVPKTINKDILSEISSYNQDVQVIDGNYADAKHKAASFHNDNKVMISGGNIDPIRVEAKKTMVFEFLRQLGKMPDVYIQAVSGGTGPIALDKGVRELNNNNINVNLPRMILVQQDECDPMVQAWEWAIQNNFPDGFENKYPSIENPKTQVHILATGNPATYPILSKLVKKTGGSFLRVKESEIYDFARIIKKEKNLMFGPASIVCFEGFYEALKHKKINNGETVLINLGESAEKAKDFIANI